MPDVPPPIPERLDGEATPTAPAPIALVATAGPLQTPIDVAPLQEIAERLEREATAAAPKDPERSRALHVRLALLAWDLGDPAASFRHAEEALPHPAAAQLVVAHALASPSVELCDRAEEIARRFGGAGRAARLLDLAEAWIYRLGDAPRAVATLHEIVSSEGPTGRAEEARELLPLALALAGEWHDLAHFLRELPPGGESEGDVPADQLLEGAHIASDRLGDAEVAARLLTRARGDDRDTFALEHLIELAGGAAPAGVDLGSLLRRKLELTPPEDPDAAVTSYLLAEHLERFGQLADAAAAYARLAHDTWGGRLALTAQRRVAIQRGAWDDAARAYLDLAQGTPFAGRAYLRRAAEIIDARLGQTARALGLYAELRAHGAAAPGLTHTLERLRLAQGDFAGLVEELEGQARSRPERRNAFLRRAAAVAESRLRDTEAAIRLRREDAGAWDDLMRLFRRQGDLAHLAQAYRGGDDPAHAVLSGLLDFAVGRLREGEDALREASRQVPDDVAPRFGLAAILRRAGRFRELADTLDGLAPLCADAGVRAAVLRELGRITATRLSDVKSARAHLEKALEVMPDDPGILEALAALASDGADWPAAVSLRERAAAHCDPGHAAALYVEIGDIEERHRGDDEGARHAYERALSLDGRAVLALRALAALHRKAKRHVELLEVLRRELDLTVDPQRRLTLFLELARTADQAVGDAEGAITAYRAALAIDPASSPALAGLERICRRDGRWDILAEAFDRAPRSARNARALAEALEKLERWPELAAARRTEVELAQDRKEAARAALLLAHLEEDKLHDPDAAGRDFRRAFELDPTDPRPLRGLARIYEARGRWNELAETLETELGLCAPQDARRLGLLLRIGEIRRDRMDRQVEAGSAFESALEIDPKNQIAIGALESIYHKLGRDGDLLRILERRADNEPDAARRADAFARIADLRERRGDVDAALGGYREAFLADPANRNTFTALERICYKRERWGEAMELYDTAIHLVESGKSRAYRLGDLYARKGQIQLTYLGQPLDAARSYLRVVELDPENDTSLRFLESIFSQQGDWESLVRAYEKRADLLADDERRIETLRRAARVAASKRKEPAEAARLYERILEIDASDHEALEALERYYEKIKEWNKLASVLTMRLTTAPAGDAAVALLMRIANICEEGLRDEGRAIEHYRRVLEIAPGSKEALDALGRIYESTEKWPEFVDVTRRLIRITTDRNVKALLYFKCGSVMESKFGKEEDAIRYYDAAIKTSPSCLPAVHGLRDLYLRRKDWQRVIQTLELEVKLWQDDKERAGVFAQIGHIHRDFLGEPERALQYYESALAVDPDCLPANRALFELHFARGEWAKAAPLSQALAQKAMREGDPAERSEFYRKRGIVSWHAGEHRSAAESLIIALEIKPENLAALDELGRLARADPTAYDFPATYRELEKIYRKRPDSESHLARVLVAQAGMVERDGDLDAAERLYGEALALVPQDFAVLSALVEVRVNMRHFAAATETIQRFLDTTPPPPPPVKVEALFRLAEIHADGEMDAARAVTVLREVLRVDPAHQEALYRLAQELAIIGRYPEAKQAVEKVIDIAAAPGATLSAESLARYYYYLGRILEAMGDVRGAGSQYRRAHDYDPGYAPVALALAKRSVGLGDRRGAETLLIQAAHVAMAKPGAGGPLAAVALQRGLARILLNAGERYAAVEAYRGILAVVPDSSDDRVALAEIYAMDDLVKAEKECLKVYERDLRHAPTYRLLASLYERMGDAERALRVASILEMLGYADEAERAQLAQQRMHHIFMARRGTLTDELRFTMLMPPAGRQILYEVFQTVALEVSGLYFLPPPGADLVPASSLDDPTLKVVIADTVRLTDVEPEVYIGRDVPGGMVALSFPRPIVALDRVLAGRPDAERRFLMGRAFESIRGGYAPLLRLGPRERHDVGVLLRSLLLPEAERPPAALEFVRQLPKKTQKALERFVVPGSAQGVDADAWVSALSQTQDRAGILACDDFAAAARMMALLHGEELATTPEGAVALGAVPDGAELVRFFLSDDYHRLRSALGEPVMRGT